MTTPREASAESFVFRARYIKAVAMHIYMYVHIYSDSFRVCACASARKCVSVHERVCVMYIYLIFTVKIVTIIFIACLIYEDKYIAGGSFRWV